MNSLRSTYFDTPKIYRDRFFKNIVPYISFVLNRLGGKQSAFYQFYANIFNISHLHQIFTTVYTIKLETFRSLVPKGLKCIFVGFADNYIVPTANLLQLETNRIIRRSLADCFNWGDVTHQNTNKLHLN